ncbi:MAG: biotin--[acetyl-CoA-carboxylase] ligase [Methanomassiliicoccales archaeon]|jgi:BirA family biotin operon repressor/biotin-[acetyl-CoA-carboxylase] ligase|nr:biotin--[acetyl-CoA-carboxylase] ligase [Methanomassiliicoccales archaeon]
MTPWTLVLRLDEVTSTNDVAKAKGKEGEPEGLVVVANRQSAGRGRMGRSWSSPEGGLYLSLLLRPGIDPDQVLRMTVLSCVPVAEAIEEVTGLRPELKWPNDVLVRGRKVAGILAEGVSKGMRLEMIVLGIGINVNTPSHELPPEATSLAAEAGNEVDRELLLQRLLENLERFYARLKADEVDEDEYKSRSCVLGHQVEAQVGRETIHGKALYLEHDGALVLRSEEGLVLRLAWVNETSIRVTKEEENDANP